MSGLSPAMAAALATIRARYAEAVTAERARWGEESAAAVAKAGIPCGFGELPERTMRALEARGLVELRAVRSSGTKLRHTSFGRWNGSKRVDSVALYAIPLPPKA